VSAGYFGKTTNLDRDRVSQQTLAERESIWGEMPGEIVDFDPAIQTTSP